MRAFGTPGIGSKHFIGGGDALGPKKSAANAITALTIALLPGGYLGASDGFVLPAGGSFTPTGGQINGVTVSVIRWLNTAPNSFGVYLENNALTQNFFNSITIGAPFNISGLTTASALSFNNGPTSSVWAWNLGTPANNAWAGSTASVSWT